MATKEKQTTPRVRKPKALPTCPWTPQHEERIERIEGDVSEIRKRVFNGMGQELRQEVADELVSVRKEFAEALNKTNTMVVGLIVALLLALAGIVIEGRVSASQVSQENIKNLEAIKDLGAKLDLHVELSKKAATK